METGPALYRCTTSFYLPAFDLLFSNVLYLIGHATNLCKCLEEMKTKGVPCDRSSYNTAVLACAEGGRLDLALSTMRVMQGMGAVSNVYLYNIA